MSSPRPNIARRRQEKKRKRQERLKRKQAQRPFGAQTAMVPWDGLEKMSDVLEEFVEPYKDKVTNEQGLRNLFNLGAAAWNAALLPEDDRKAVLDGVLREHRIPSADQEFVRGFLQELIDRKEAHYSANRRYFGGVVLKNMGDSYHLSVVSSLPLPPAPKECNPGEA